MSIIATAICPLPASRPPSRPPVPAAAPERSRARVDMRHTLRCPTVGARVDGATRRTRELLWPTVWATVLAVLMLGGALGPGYVLSYDMVWVPDLAVTPDVWGVGTALPRAVPSDAVVALLDTVIPGMLLQKVVLLGSLVAAGAGAAALVGGRSLGTQLVAASLMVWNPFVVERLMIGHWPVLVGYAVLPWLLLVGRRWDVGTRLPVV